VQFLFVISQSRVRLDEPQMKLPTSNVQSAPETIHLISKSLYNFPHGP
jgi:hypothetical protein